MAITARFITSKGIKRWKVSPSGVVDFDGFSTAFELNADNNSAVEGSPLTNQRGMKKKPLSFVSRLNAALGVDVREEFESWEAWVGLTGKILIENKRFGTRWLLKSVKPSEVVIDDSGRFRSMKLTFSFEENSETATSASVVSTVSATKTATEVTASTEDKEQKKATNTALDAAAKMLPNNTGVSLGSIVQFLGGPCYLTSTSKNASAWPAEGKAKITITAIGAPHPFHLIHTDEDSTVFGWVDASEIKKLN